MINVDNGFQPSPTFIETSSGTNIMIRYNKSVEHAHHELRIGFFRKSPPSAC
jgi:hypothetical protein